MNMKVASPESLSIHHKVHAGNSKGDYHDLEVHVPYFFSYKTKVFPFQNNPKNLDPA